MINFKSLLLEKISPEEAAKADKILAGVAKKLDVVKMKAGESTNKFGDKNIEIRIKPSLPDQDRDTILKALEKFLKSLKTVEKVKYHKISPNSGKFSSVSFTIGDRPYDIVVAAGANKGEKFENELLQTLVNYHVGGMSDESLESLLIQMEEADPGFKRGNIKKIEGRTGATKRVHLDPSKHGEVIADIIITMKDDTKKYLSIKNKVGATFANIGYVSKAFDSNFKLDTSSDIGKILLDAGFNNINIQKGFQAYVDQTPVKFKVKQNPVVEVNKGSPLYKFLEHAWGYNYFYVKEHGKGFKVFKIDKKSLHNVLLDELIIYEINYPFKDSKQISIKFGNAFAEYKLEIRNPHGPGKVKPSDAKIKLTKIGF